MATITAAPAGGNWSAGTTWIGGVAPGAADDAVIGATTLGSVTLDIDVSVGTLDCTGYAGQLQFGSHGLQINGLLLRFDAGMTISIANVATVALWFAATAGTVVIDTKGLASGGGQVLGLNVAAQLGAVVVASTATYQLASAANLNRGNVKVYGGTLDTNGKTVSCGILSCGVAGNSAAATAVTLGASTITCDQIVFSSHAASTVNAGTSSVTFATATFSTTPLANDGVNIPYDIALYDVACAMGTRGVGFGIQQISTRVAASGSTTYPTSVNALTLHNLTVTSGATSSNSLNLGLFSAITVAGTLTLTGNSRTQPLSVVAQNGGWTLPVSAAAVSLANVVFRDVAAGGAAGTWAGTALHDGGGNSGITFAASVTYYWIGTAGGNWSDGAKWSLSSGGGAAGTTPLFHDDVKFDANSIGAAGQTVTMDTSTFFCRDLDAGAVTNSPTISVNPSGTANIAGSLTLAAGMTLGGTGKTLALGSRDAAHSTLACNGATILCQLAIGAQGEPFPIQGQQHLAVTVYTLTSDVTFGTPAQTTQGFRVQAGGLDTAGFNITAPWILFDNGANGTGMQRRIWLRSSTLTCTVGSSGQQVFGCKSTYNLTLDAGTSTVVIANTGSTARTLGCGNQVAGFQSSYADFTINNLTVQTGAGVVRLQAVAGGTSKGLVVAGTLTLAAPVTVTIDDGAPLAWGTISAVGTAGNLITIHSTSHTATPATAKQAVGNVSCDYLSLRDIAASGSTPFYAGKHSTDEGGNTGWSFTSLDVVPVGAVSGAATVSCSLGRVRSRSAAVSGTTLASATVVRVRSRSAAVAGTATVSATLVRTRGLAAAVHGVATVAATTVRIRARAASANGTTSVSASLGRIRPLAATARGTTTVGVAVHLATTLTAAAHGAASVSAHVVRARAFSPSAHGTATVSAAVVRIRARSAAANGTTTVGVHLDDERRVSPDPVLASATVAAAVVRIRAMRPSVSGRCAVVAAVIVPGPGSGNIYDFASAGGTITDRRSG